MARCVGPDLIVVFGVWIANLTLPVISSAQKCCFLSQRPGQCDVGACVDGQVPTCCIQGWRCLNPNERCHEEELCEDILPNICPSMLTYTVISVISTICVAVVSFIYLTHKPFDPDMAREENLDFDENEVKKIVFLKSNQKIDLKGE